MSHPTQYAKVLLLERKQIEAAVEVDLMSATLEAMLNDLAAEIATSEPMKVLTPKYSVELHWLMPNPDAGEDHPQEPPMISVDSDEEWTAVQLRVSAVVE